MVDEQLAATCSDWNDFAAENVSFFTGPYGERAKVGKPVIDRAAKVKQAVDTAAEPAGAMTAASSSLEGRLIGERYTRTPVIHA